MRIKPTNHGKAVSKLRGLKNKCEQNISFPEARKHYKQFYGAKTYASAVKPCNKATQTEDKTTQTGHSITEYKKINTNENARKSQEKSKESKTLFSSCASPQAGNP